MESDVMDTTTLEVGKPLAHPPHLQEGLESLEAPDAATPADQVDANGYEWINFPPNSQTNFYRAPGEKEWILWEN